MLQESALRYTGTEEARGTWKEARMAETERIKLTKLTSKGG